MNCIICRNTLSGLQKKYCSRTCADFQKAERQHRKFAKDLGTRKCPVCKTDFKPLRSNNIFCSQDCLQKHQAKAKRSGRALHISTIPLNVVTHTNPHFNENCNSNKTEILRYLKNGGTITTLPVAPAGKSPQVSFKHAWVPTEIYGNGLLYDMGEEHE